MNRVVLVAALAAASVLPVQGGLAAPRQISGQDIEAVLKRADGLFEAAKTAYDTAREKSSVEFFTEAAFKLEEARIKYIVVQEIGSAEMQKTAGERLRNCNQLNKLIHDGKVAISGKAVGEPAAKPAATPAPEAPPSPDSKPPAVPALPAPAGPSSARAPVPDAAKQKEAEKQIKELYKDQYAKKAGTDRLALAKELLNQAASAEPILKWVLYREAQDLALQGADVRVALQAADGAAAAFDVDPFGLRNAVLAAAVKSAKAAEEFTVLTSLLLHLIEDLIAVDDYDLAEKVSATAGQAARRSGDQALVARAALRTKEIPEARTKFASMKKSLETLAKSPEDPAANLEMGQFLCFFKSSWDLGLRFVVKGSDPALKAAAEKDLALPSQSMAQIAAGDAWWDLGDKEKNAVRKEKLYERGRYWYQLALQGAPALLKSRIEKRLAGSSTGERETVNLLKLVDLAKDSVKGPWTFQGAALACTPFKDGFARLQLPYIPPAEYDLTLTVERLVAKDFFYVGLVSEATAFGVQIDVQGRSSLEMVDGKDITTDANPTVIRTYSMPNNRPVTFKIAVRKTEVIVSADGKVVISWQGGMARLSSNSFWSIPNGGLPYLGCFYGGFRFSNVTLTTLSEPGKKFR